MDFEDPTIQLVALPLMDDAQISKLWVATFNRPAPAISRELLVLSLAYRMQEGAYGELSPKARAAIDATVKHLTPLQARSRSRATKLPIGTRLIREWKGQTFVVVAAFDGFSLNGEMFSSLTQIAHKITGFSYPGPRFFGLRKRRRVIASSNSA